eukprot:gene25157-31580_t
MSGVANVAKFWYSVSQIAPDVVVKIISTDVHSSPKNDCSKLVARFSISATKIYDVSDTQRYTVEEIQRNEELMNDTASPVGSKRKCGMSNKLSVVGRIASSVAGLTKRMSLAVNPLPTHFEGTLTMHVDEASGRVGRMVMEGALEDMNLDKSLLDAHCPYCNAKKLFLDTQVITPMDMDAGRGEEVQW